LVGLTINNQELTTSNSQFLNDVFTTYSDTAVATDHSYPLSTAAKSNPQTVSYRAWGFVSVSDYRDGVFLSQ
jgi:hypothetical protein